MSDPMPLNGAENVPLPLWCASGCDRPRYRRGLCTACYYAHRKATQPPCTIDGCTRPINAKGLCMTHGQRLRRHGTTDLIAGTDTDTRRTPDWMIDYRAAHLRVTATRGRADHHPCIDCGRQAQEWSYTHSGIGERVDVVRGSVLLYSSDPTQFDPRCRKCHRKFDAP